MTGFTSVEDAGLCFHETCPVQVAVAGKPLPPSEGLLLDRALHPKALPKKALPEMAQRTEDAVLNHAQLALAALPQEAHQQQVQQLPSLAMSPVQLPQVQQSQAPPALAVPQLPVPPPSGEHPRRTLACPCVKRISKRSASMGAGAETG